MPPSGIELVTEQTVTQVGLVDESASNPILLHSVVAQASMQVDTLEDKYGDVFARAWGNRSISYDVELDQLAQYGISDNYLGRIDATLLENLTDNFGMGTDSGTALLTSGERSRSRGRIPRVSLNIEVQDTRDAGLGSPDGTSTPAWGGTPAGTKPTITLASPQTGTIGTPLSITITATGTATITYSLAPGVTLPAGLSLAAGVISGTPTGAASTTYIEIRASNAYGTHSKIIKLVISAAAVAAPEEVQAYVRYLVDSNSTTIPDGFWALSYSGMSPDPTDDTSFLSGTPGSYAAPSSDPGLPSNPNALTGTIGARAWEITEILGWSGTEYEYWYQRDSSKDTALLDAINLGLDPVTEATVTLVSDEDIGTDGPGDEGDPTWPGTILDDDRMEQYWVVWDALADTYQVTGVGGDQVCETLEIFMAKHPSLSLKWTETKTKVLTEIYNKPLGGSPGYLYKASASHTRISTALAIPGSPIWYAGTIEGVRGRTSLPYVVPEYAFEDLPTPPAAYTGAAIDARTWLYMLERLWDGGGYQISGWYSTTLPTNYPTLQELCDQLGKVTSDEASATPHTETTAGKAQLVEVWAYNGTTWKSIWLDDSLTPATSLIGGFIADDVSPINHASGHPGKLYPVYVPDWIG
jgi:hypothetical protein